MQFEVPPRIGLALPDPARIAKIRESFAKSVSPARTLPSNAMMMLFCVAAFIVLAIVLTAPVGFLGFAKLSATGAVIEFSVVILLALVLAGSALEQMIPGSRRTMSPGWSVLLAILLLSVTALLLFPGFDTREFMRHGLPCLRFGVLCAIPGAGCTALMMGRGFVVDTVQAAVAGGALSGMLGIGVLALHCPVLNAAHIIAWHVAVIAVTSLSGAFLGWIMARYR